MLPSPTAEHRKSKTLRFGTFSLISCEAHRDLVLARVNLLNQRAAHRTGILKPLTVRCPQPSLTRMETASDSGDVRERVA